MPAARTPDHPAFLHVYAVPKTRAEYVAGVSPDGSDIEWERAQLLIAAGLVSLEPPKPPRPPTAVAAPAEE